MELESTETTRRTQTMTFKNITAGQSFRVLTRFYSDVVLTAKADVQEDPFTVAMYGREPMKVLCTNESGEEFYHLASARSEEHTSELQSRGHLVCRLLLEKKNNTPQKLPT